MGESPLELPPPNARTPRRWVFRTTAIVVAVLSCEILLQCASWLVPGVDWALMSAYQRERSAKSDVMIEDDAIGWRGDPEHPAHDRLGFNNRSVPQRVDFVAIGDSLTYGVIGSPNLSDRVPVSWQTAWPAVLEELTGKKSYNMGLGGWGPVEYGQILNEALALKPQTITFAFYFGNDLFNAFRSVYVYERGTDLADPTLAQDVADSLNESSPLDPFNGVFTLKQMPPAPATYTASLVRFGWTLLSEHCKLYGMARGVKDFGLSTFGATPTEAGAAGDDWAAAVEWAAKHPERCRAVEAGRFRTVLMAPYRYPAVNLDDVRIRAGLSITQEVIRRTAIRCQDQGIEFLVVFLPTKEFVFEAIIDHPDDIPKYPETLTWEREVRNKLGAFLDGHGIRYVDALDSLRECFDRGEQPYAISADDHPNAVGYRAIAEAVAKHCRLSNAE